MIGKVTVTSSGYNPDLPKGHPDHCDPTLGPPEPRAWTAGELAAVLLTYPADMPVIGFGQDVDGAPALTATLVVTTREKLQRATADQPTTCLVVMPIENE